DVVERPALLREALGRGRDLRLGACDAMRNCQGCPGPCRGDRTNEAASIHDPPSRCFVREAAMLIERLRARQGRATHRRGVSRHARVAEPNVGGAWADISPAHERRREAAGCGRRRFTLNNALQLGAPRPHRKSREENAMRMIDLSRELYHRTPTYPGQPPIIHGVWKTHEESF